MKMTKKQFVEFFRAEIMPEIRKIEGKAPDYVLRAEEWNNITDSMVQDRQLPKSALEWSNPFDLR